MVNREISGILAQSNQLTIIGVIGDGDECKALIETITKQNVNLQTQED